MAQVYVAPREQRALAVQFATGFVQLAFATFAQKDAHRAETSSPAALPAARILS